MKTVNVKSLGDCPYLISLDSQEIIGQGSYGKVVKAYNKNDPSQNLVAKIFNFADPKRCSSALQELKIVSQLPKHPNLIQYKKIKITSKNNIYIIMENCTKGSLRSKIEEKKKDKLNGMKYQFQQKQIWQFICSFVEGYKVLFQKFIIHRDIKPQNILIGSDGSYKICDFGLAQLLWQLSEHNFKAKAKGSLFYMAPQLFNNISLMTQSLSPNQKIKVDNDNDVYSFGVTIYYMCFGHFPYIGSHYPSSLKEYLRILKNNTLSFPEQQYLYSNQLKELISSMLQKDPLMRCSWEYIFLQTKYKCPKIQQIKQNLQNDQQTPSKKISFKIVQISDTLLKNLSLMDINLNQSLKKESIVIVDHIQAQILSKRDFIFFCDRLYVQLEKISSLLFKNKENDDISTNSSKNKEVHTLKSNKVTKINLEILQSFMKNIIFSNYIYSKQLFIQFDKYYQKIEKSQFLKLITSKKYEFMKRIITQDFKNLQQLIQQENYLKQINQLQEKHKQGNFRHIDAEVYKNCGTVAQMMIYQRKFSLAIQIDQLQQWYEKKNSSILFKTRKNQNALRQFTIKIDTLSNQQIEKLLSKRYHNIFKKVITSYD